MPWGTSSAPAKNGEETVGAADGVLALRYPVDAASAANCGIGVSR